ncbi:hypothetical protein jhhlp_002974 [Lomentospora prolificans]|uniref:Uncharacterized protein n=1 Tax=Lomentospora prolificans TaxID=41688 RepID=A0A2N3NFK7_9PEZI|nr:hypothetical protein jhhlp_002974 [Lomentospora prolificans]
MGVGVYTLRSTAALDLVCAAKDEAMERVSHDGDLQATPSPLMQGLILRREEFIEPRPFSKT